MLSDCDLQDGSTEQGWLHFSEDGVGFIPGKESIRNHKVPLSCIPLRCPLLSGGLHLCPLEPGPIGETMS